jgi:hypothetical protein
LSTCCWFLRSSVVIVLTPGRGGILHDRALRVHQLSPFRCGHRRTGPVPPVAGTVWLSSAVLDANSIEWGARWPDRIASRLRRATIVLPVIGEKWLLATDQYGRRRFDDPKDWVHLELLESLRQRSQVLPILLNDVTMPPPEALPNDLAELAEHQGMTLRTGTEEWQQDLGRRCSPANTRRRDRNSSAY